MSGALNQLVGSHQRISDIETHNINLRALVFLSGVGMLSEQKMVHSYPSIVRRFQIGGLNSSLGVSESSFTLGIMYQMHIGSWEWLLKT